MSSGTTNDSDQVPQRSLPIQQDDKLFSRLLSKESSMANPSSRVLYYGGRRGSVPFLWESEPGTPKSKSWAEYESLIPPLTPPLTPPPSYYNNSHKNNDIQKGSKSSTLLKTLFPKKVSLKKTPCNTRNSFWSNSENSSMLVSLNNAPKTVGAGFCGRTSRTTSRFLSSSSSSFDCRGEEEDQEVGSPNSTLCFGCYRL